MLLQGEASLGDRFAKKAQKQLPMLADEEVNNYVKKIGHKIAAVAGRDEFEYEFFVIMDENLNAFALPGGKVFVNLGAIMNTDSEAELAGLLAHEVAHSVLSHGFQLVTRGNLTSNVAQYIPYVGSTASSLIVMNYSRDMERQADVFGTRILVAADYSADGVRNLMAKLGKINAEDEENPEPPAWLSTHPNTNQRVSYIEELIVSNNLNRYAYEGVMEHQKMKHKANKLWQKYQAEQEKKEEENRE
jgi:beta-barrel assembly-enhancing protease